MNYALVIQGETHMLVGVRLDGTIEYGEGYEPDAAARIFWDALGQSIPPSLRPRVRTIWVNEKRVSLPVPPLSDEMYGSHEAFVRMAFDDDDPGCTVECVYSNGQRVAVLAGQRVNLVEGLQVAVTRAV